MKLLVVADLHYALPQFDWLVSVAADYELIIIAGDLLDISSSVDPGTQIVVVLNYLQKLRALTSVVVCSGNHDLDAEDADGERRAGWMRKVKRAGIAADGDTIIAGDMLITICPWWDGPLTQAEIGHQLEAASTLRRGEWLWVYHAPPSASPVSWSGQRHFGDDALRPWIDKLSPTYVISGHVHEAPFARNGSWVDRIGDTWLFNGGKQIGAVPTTIAIDTAAKEAAWFSLEGAESVSLSQPLVRPIPPLTQMPAWMEPAG